MSVEWRPVHHSVAGSAVLGGVSAAAVTETRDVADEDLVGAEAVPVGAAAGRFRHPPAANGAYKLPLEHLYQLMAEG